MSDHQPTIKTYLLVYILLLAGLAATVGVAYLHLGYANVAVSLMIAFTKATLVVWYFMHVKSSPELNKIAICAGLVWLCILFGLTLVDYGSRSWIAPYGQQYRNTAYRTPTLDSSSYEKSKK
jgi:cytochrome c oxidase subunit IV